MTARSSVSLGTAVLLAAAHLNAQMAENPLAKLRKAGTPEASGTVTVFYGPSAGERAIALQKSLETAHAWYEKRFGVHVPIVLVLLDADMAELITESTQVPHNTTLADGMGLIFIPNAPNANPARRQPIAGADRDHSPGGTLAGEHVL